MIELELKQVDITAKKGEEVAALDAELIKLQTKKQELEKTTPIAQKNTDEYRNARDAIQAQIDNLNTAKTRVQEITSAAQTMNYELGREIRKTIITDQIEYLTQVRKTPLPSGPQEQKHTGGIVGKLHVGGLASQFSELPNHNEVDVRLLRNEMVLTEAQQANLMRMLDAGIASSVSTNEPLENTEVVRLLREIERGIAKGMNATVIMDERIVGQSVEPYVTERQEYNEKVARAFGGRR